MSEIPRISVAAHQQFAASLGLVRPVRPPLRDWEPSSWWEASRDATDIVHTHPQPS